MILSGTSTWAANSSEIRVADHYEDERTYLWYPIYGNFLKAAFVSHDAREGKPANNPTERTCGLKWLVPFVDEDEVEEVARAELMFTSRKIGIRSNSLRNSLTGVVSLW